jgi:hypothetical protein
MVERRCSLVGNSTKGCRNITPSISDRIPPAAARSASPVPTLLGSADEVIE